VGGKKYIMGNLSNSVLSIEYAVLYGKYLLLFSLKLQAC
jgi:hypothetical protein